jgi:hypothetical protein
MILQQKEQKEELIGSDIKEIYTLKSWYDNDSILIRDKNGNPFRIKVEDLLILFDYVTFNIKKKRVHKYLTVENLVIPELGISHNLQSEVL